MFGSSEYVWDLNEKVSGYECGLRKIKQKYSDRINVEYGYVEMTDFVLKNQYELIILTEVFEHFALNPVNMMRKLANALAENGQIMLTTPNWGPAYIYKTWEDLPDPSEISNDRYMQLIQAGHVYQYSKDELIDIFLRSGLKVENYSISDSNNHNFVLIKQ